MRRPFRCRCTCRETLPRVSRIKRSRTWRAVTNFPSRPANGESLTKMRIRIVGGSMSTNCSGCRSSRVGQGLADVNFFEAGQADDVAGAACLISICSRPCVSEKSSHVRTFAAAVAVNADDRVAHGDAPADDPAQRDAPEIIAVIEVGNEHLENTGSSEVVGGGMCLTMASKSGVMSSLFLVQSRAWQSRSSRWRK